MPAEPAIVDLSLQPRSQGPVADQKKSRFGAVRNEPLGGQRAGPESPLCRYACGRCEAGPAEKSGSARPRRKRLATDGSDEPVVEQSAIIQGFGENGAPANLPVPHSARRSGEP